MKKEKLLIVGHRGVAAIRPENTIASFKAAIDMGLDGIETDIYMTTDGELVLMHDCDLERTAGIKGDIRSFSLDELRRFDVGASFSAEYAGETIPTFREFLELTSDKHLILNIEIKDARDEVTDKAVRLINEYGIKKDEYVITSWHSSVTEYAVKKYGVRTQGFPLNYYGKEQRPESYSGFYSVGICMMDLTKDFCDELKGQGIEPWCWCPDTDEEVKKAIQCGSPLATVNDPRPALRFRNSLQ